MPWQTPTLAEVRQQNRDYLVGRLGVPLIPNSVARVLADANGGNAHLALQYLDWLSLQLLPDTAETVFLDKWGDIFLVNADGSRGRKQATLSTGTITVTGVTGTIFPAGTQLTSPGSPAVAMTAPRITNSSPAVGFEVVTAATVGSSATTVSVRALDPGAASNLAAGTGLSIATAVTGVDGQSATVASLTGGADEETDDELRARVLDRIRNPPMGGDANDYVAWALQVPGVTRAWCSPNEVAIGTVTVRVMCDDLRATVDPTTNGFPVAEDLAAVRAYIDTVRPVTLKEFWVTAPIPQPVNGIITDLSGDSVSLRAAIDVSIGKMLRQRAKPAYALNGVGQPPTTIPAAWVSDAIFTATAGAAFDLVMADAVMANNGCLAVLGTFG